MPIFTDTLAIDSTKDTYRLIRERVFYGVDITQLVGQLRVEKCTGTLSVDMSQGGICRIRFREEQDIRYETSK